MDGTPEYDSFAPQTKETELGAVKNVYRNEERSYLPKPLGDPLGGENSVRARVTLKNIRLAYHFTIAYGSTSEAELVNAELI